MNDLIYIPVSLGELIDKITILQIKLNKFTNEKQLINVKNELSLLLNIFEKYNVDIKLQEKLYDVNLKMWEWHDWQRQRISQMQKNIIDEEFYFKSFCEHQLNDERARIKKQINLCNNSYIIEEKQFPTHII